MEYSTSGILVNNSGFWMSMEWFGGMQYCLVYSSGGDARVYVIEGRILVQYFGVVQYSLEVFP